MSILKDNLSPVVVQAKDLIPGKHLIHELIFNTDENGKPTKRDKLSLITSVDETLLGISIHYGSNSFNQVNPTAKIEVYAV